MPLGFGWNLGLLDDVESLQHASSALPPPATFVLVVVVTLVWSTLSYLDLLTAERTRDLKIIVSEKWQANGGLPITYAAPISEGAADPNHPDDVRPQDSMTWQIYLGTMDREKNTREDLVILIALDPAKIPTILESFLHDIDPGRARDRKDPAYTAEAQQMAEAVALMQQNKKGVIIGQTRLQEMKKKVGERFTLKGLTYADLDLEFEIVGTFPHGRFDLNGVMNRDYLNDALDAYARAHAGRPHPMAAKTLNLVWLQVRDTEEFTASASRSSNRPCCRRPRSSAKHSLRASTRRSKDTAT